MLEQISTPVDCAISLLLARFHKRGEEAADPVLLRA
jgi:hypothetical protein